eukprot:m.286975 g.286975  ORF g.286975 m.286975 type:complete len:88 (+) comp11680_c0_seq1:211-474(+)
MLRPQWELAACSPCHIGAASGLFAAQLHRSFCVISVLVFCCIPITPFLAPVLVVSHRRVSLTSTCASTCKSGTCCCCGFSAAPDRAF